MEMIDDDLKEVSDCSVLLDSLNANPNEETLSPADVAWADSCLSKDVGALDTDWSSVKDSLMEILTSQPQSGRQPTVNENLLPRESVRNLGFDRRYDQDEDLIDEDHDIGDAQSIEISEDNEGYLAFGNKNGRARGRSRFDSNVFRPNYTEEIGKVKHLSFGMALSLTTYEVEPLSEDIFKVWDLGIANELDDFTKEFSKPFVEVPEEIQLISDDSTSWNDSMDVSVDHLIAGVGRLSLIQRTK